MSLGGVDNICYRTNGTFAEFRTKHTGIFASCILKFLCKQFASNQISVKIVLKTVF